MGSSIVIGLDTDSHGFHWVSSEPLWDGSGDDPNKARAGYNVSSAELESRRALSYLTARSFFSSVDQLAGNVSVHVFCEEPLALQNGKTTRILGLAAGAIWAAFVQTGGRRTNRYWYWVDVAHWKKEIVGKGNASKTQIRDFCLGNPAWKDLSGQDVWTEDPESDYTYASMFEHNHNLYDAWCLKVYGVRQLAGI